MSQNTKEKMKPWLFFPFRGNNEHGNEQPSWNGCVLVVLQFYMIFTSFSPRILLQIGRGIYEELHYRNMIFSWLNFKSFNVILLWIIPIDCAHLEFHFNGYVVITSGQLCEPNTRDLWERTIYN